MLKCRSDIKIKSEFHLESEETAPNSLDFQFFIGAENR
jgi:hypothetical protein